MTLGGTKMNERIVFFIYKLMFRLFIEYAFVLLLCVYVVNKNSLFITFQEYIFFHID